MLPRLYQLVKNHITIVLLIGIILFASLRLFDNYRNQNFNIDEYLFIKKSYYFDLFFIKHDLSDPRWFIYSQGDDVPQPKVGPYIYGMALHLSGISNIEEFFKKINFISFTIDDKPWWITLWNKEPKTFPKDLSASLNLIWLGRRTSILFAVGSIVILFILGRKLVDLLFALVSSFLQVTNSLFNYETKYATTDTMQLFFFFCNLLLCCLWFESYKTKNKRNLIICSLLLGANAALAAGIKTSGLLVSFFLSIFIILIILISKYFKQSIKGIMIAAVIIGATCSILFYFLHPFLWGNTFNALKKMYYTRTLTYKDYWTEYPSKAIYTHTDSLVYIYQRTLAANGYFVNFYLDPIPADLILFLTGFILVSSKAFSQLKAKKNFLIGILPLWSIIVFISLVFYLYNDWSRYYLPLVSCITLIEGYAITLIFQQIYKIYRREFA